MPAVTRSQAYTYSCDYCGEQQGLGCARAHTDKMGAPMCPECAEDLVVREYLDRYCKIKILIEFKIPDDTPYMEDIEEWVRDEMSMYHEAGWPSGQDWTEWISELTTLTPREMEDFIIPTDEDYASDMEFLVQKWRARRLVDGAVMW